MSENTQLTKTYRLLKEVYGPLENLSQTQWAQIERGVKVLMKEEGFDSNLDYVRVGVKSGGCSGLSYNLNFDKKLTELDTVYEDNDVKIIVDKKSLLYLIGTTLEYSGGLNGKGFVFNNPNAERTCGCGESFSL